MGLITVLSACGSGQDDSGAVVIYANSSIAPWLTNAAEEFNAQRVETINGDLVSVVVTPFESGQFVDAALEVGDLPDIWVPENESWADLLVDQGLLAFGEGCVSLASSPLVIGMWQPVAESLGYPGRELGWLDIGSLAADPSAWAYYSGGQYGSSLRIGHTHPGVSGSGTSTLLAIVQAAQSKAEAVDAAEIDQPIVQSSVGSFSGAVSWFSSSTNELASTMRERGSGYLGAGIMYESDVLRYQAGEPNLIPVYPFEGTFMASHPACINTTSEREPLDLVLRHFLSAESQQMAVSFGLRPAVTEGVEIVPPLTEAQGVNLAEPSTVFEDGSFDSIYAIQDLWQSSRKPLNLVMVLDVSGSMEGGKITGLRDAAVQFVQQMGENDRLTLVPFADRPVVWLESVQVSQNLAEATQLIQGLEPRGGTALYDAIGFAGEQIERSASPETANVVIVLTDGVDTASYNYRFDDDLLTRLINNNATVFTVAYGRDADEDVLTDIALAANGKSYTGDAASIEDIYEEMSLAFGGTVGVGR
ncbi:MAG: VWA domain-containing protein [Chloroflexota bacterium]